MFFLYLLASAVVLNLILLVCSGRRVGLEARKETTTFLVFVRPARLGVFKEVHFTHEPC